MARVLVVDDQRISRVSLQSVLAEAGHDVRAVSSGSEGLAEARAWAPDVIILDLNMPGMDGFEVVERLKTEPRTEPIPVIFLTAEAPTDELVVRGLDLGAYDFLAKGGSKAELQARVAAMARVKRAYDELSAIARISDTLIRTIEPEDLVRVFVEQTRDVFRGAGALAVLRRAGDEPDLVAGAGVDPEAPLCGSFADELLERFGDGTEGAVILSSADLPGPPGAWMRREGFHSGLATSVRRERRPPMLLAVFRERERSFRPDSDPRLLHALAQQATIALDNALLHAESRAQARRLGEQARQLERAMNERSRFFASLSHEIRTPINAVIGYNQLLEEGVFGDLEGGQRDAVENVSRAAQHLLELINDILDISKLEAGKFQVAMEPVDLAELLRDTATSIRLQAEEKGLRFHVEAPSDVTVQTDPARVRQILLNLLSNAVKFTEEGEVVASLETGTNDGPVTLTVRDTGSGIAPGDQERIFDEFEQVDGGPEARRGTGLGLAISRKLARLLGGDLELESTPGKGSTFALVLPTIHPGETPAGTAPADAGDQVEVAPPLAGEEP